MRAFIVFLCLGLVVALPAAAVDLVTNGLVDIIDGLTVTQTTGLNFGVLVLNSGTVVVSAADGSYTDGSSLVYDNTNISQGIFSVDTNVGVDITVTCSAGTMPAGLVLGAFTADWADAGAEAPVPVPRTTAAATEVLEIGASLAVDRTTAVPTGGTPADLPYTVSVTFQ
jgi:hypothetical protein